MQYLNATLKKKKIFYSWSNTVFSKFIVSALPNNFGMVNYKRNRFVANAKLIIRYRSRIHQTKASYIKKVILCTGL